MRELLLFILTEITGNSDITVTEAVQDNKIDLMVQAPSDTVGLIIGKEGKTIKNIRRILAIRATQDDTVVSVSVNP
jgi:predicted RNA-binding protein YlqC (UPF0109 family)